MWSYNAAGIERVYKNSFLTLHFISFSSSRSNRAFFSLNFFFLVFVFYILQRRGDCRGTFKKILKPLLFLWANIENCSAIEPHHRVCETPLPSLPHTLPLSPLIWRYLHELRLIFSLSLDGIFFFCCFKGMPKKKFQECKERESYKVVTDDSRLINSWFKCGGHLWEMLHKLENQVSVSNSFHFWNVCVSNSILGTKLPAQPQAEVKYFEEVSCGV